MSEIDESRIPRTLSDHHRRHLVRGVRDAIASRPRVFRRSLLRAAITAHQDLWTRGGPDAIERRNDAVAAAIQAGWAPEDLGRALDVLPEDISRWSSTRSLPALRL